MSSSTSTWPSPSAPDPPETFCTFGAGELGAVVAVVLGDVRLLEAVELPQRDRLAGTGVGRAHVIGALELSGREAAARAGVRVHRRVMHADLPVVQTGHVQHHAGQARRHRRRGGVGVEGTVGPAVPVVPQRRAERLLDRRRRPTRVDREMVAAHRVDRQPLAAQIVRDPVHLVRSRPEAGRELLRGEEVAVLGRMRIVHRRDRAIQLGPVAQVQADRDGHLLAGGHRTQLRGVAHAHRVGGKGDPGRGGGQRDGGRDRGDGERGDQRADDPHSFHFGSPSAGQGRDEHNAIGRPPCV